ncbi:MAG: hypothetical protein EOP10_10935 [Proteobacteria bacterium]|nr:MAG: hypothetical protein EOP10_10935 [Pseudomonadota bacterium]
MSRRSLALATPCLVAALMSTQASAIFVDGHGYYGIRGEARTKPENIPASSASQTIDQFFRLDTEIRANDKASAFLEFKIFDDERESYMGDRSLPQDCPSGSNAAGTNDPACRMNAPNSIEPHYYPLQPKITKAYVKYSMDYCLITAGRRGRSWGMGLFLDDGTKPFATDASVFDGVTCDINIQKSQTLGFSIGYDKIAETGGSVLYSGDASRAYGPSDNGDDLDQLFLTIEYNDHKANAGKGFSKQIGIYFANVIGGDNSKTDVKIADLYLNFLMNNFVWQNEVYFRLGKSADPSFALLGGYRTRTEEEGKVENDVQSIALAGSLDYYISRSGTYTGPKEYNQGTATSQSIFFNYAYAPGDKDGYYPEYPNDPGAPTQRDKKASAVAFHKNFKPALLLFNGRKRNDNRRVDGAYDPYRLMNATIYSLGYRYQSIETGDFEAKLVTAELNEAMPDDLTLAPEKRVGSYGTTLGYELDLGYSKKLGKEFEFGVAAGIGIPGDAQRTRADEDAVNNYMIQSFAAFHF